MRKLPVDISTFSELRALDYIYVDKTHHMYNLITGGRRYFLSRPRRFGKSLLISTFKEILSGNKQLFNDLWIGNSDYQWQQHGVVVFDFSTLAIDNETTFDKGLIAYLMSIATQYEISLDNSSEEPNILLKALISELFKRFNRVAILVDEYDSPLLKTLHNETLAQAIRDKIQQFFTTIKALDAYIQFVFITGVSSFVKAGLFSGINNLQILTLRDKYAAICGYTDEEIDYYFADYITDWSKTSTVSYDELRQKIKFWYNGYSFGNNVAKIYNPFSVMNALQIKDFENFWFVSGAPTFLIESLKKNYHSFDLNNLQTSRDALGIFDVGAIPTVSLMFQAGYLTIVDYDPESEQYRLDYPNWEVKKSLQKYLLEVFAHIDATKAQQLSSKLFTTLNNENIEDAVETIQQLFTHVPYQLHKKEESFYHSLLIMACISAGIKNHAEYSISHGLSSEALAKEGRVDLILELPKILYIIEIKFNDSAENALTQIEKQRYHEKFISYNKPIILLGLSFKRKPRHFTITYVMKKL